MGGTLEFDVTAAAAKCTVASIAIEGDVPDAAALINTETPARKVFRWKPDSTTPAGVYTVSFKATNAIGLKDIQSVKIAVQAALAAISAHREGDFVILDWNGGGNLESATTVAGPWIPFPKPDRPDRVHVSEEASFFRVVPAN